VCVSWLLKCCASFIFKTTVNGLMAAVKAMGKNSSVNTMTRLGLKNMEIV